MTQYKSYYKINLGLNILDLDKSKKHNIESIFIKMFDVCDLIEIDNSTIDNKIEYFDSNNTKLSISNCLIVKVLKYLSNKFSINKKYKIKIIKNIPLSSGLGGGSSNAACIINHIINDNSISFNELDMYEIAIELGSDIPFFLHDYKQAFVKGIGNIVEELKLDLSYLDINVIFPNYEISTKKIFNDYLSCSTNQPKNNYNEILKLIKEKQFFKLFNNLEHAFKGSDQDKSEFIILSQLNDIAILNGSGASKITINFKKGIRTRYAPSPTGFFHIGGARTAIFNYLYAKKQNGKFILRIEDTDIERNQEGGIESQYSNLRWLGLNIDESIFDYGDYGPYIQSKKIQKYKLIAESLVEQNKAYYCFCSKQELDEQREKLLANHQTPKYQRTCLNLSKEDVQNKIDKKIPYVIRLKMKDNYNYSWDDLVRGNISVPTSALTDPVLIKANGIAMYNFAVVIDDFDMKISHVLRGEEHISNTPYQLAIAEAIYKHPIIKYGHLSIITDHTGKKLSKRNKELKQFIEDYKDLGFIPESLFNFLSLLGWSPKTNNEILSISDIIKNFDINAVSKSPAFFDEKKLLWISNEYFKKQNNDEYLAFVDKYIESEIKIHFQNDIFNEILLLFKSQISSAFELNALINEYFFKFDVKLIDSEIEILRKSKDLIIEFKNQILNLNEYNEENISNIINNIKTIFNKKGQELFMPIRISTTKKSHGPSLSKIIFLIGKKQVLDNLNNSLKLI